VDFDFVGLEFYPKGLNVLSSDGARHNDVVDAIKNDTIDQLKPEKKHDWFSMARMLKLFTVTSNTEGWQQAISLVENGKLSDAIALLQEREEDTISPARAL
jgi:hypothetical protein